MRSLGILAALGVGCCAAVAASDPLVSPLPPVWAVGGAERAATLDALPGFRQPPPGFGIVPFYWWLGDPLTKERLAWQLEQMAGMGVAGYQINYAHSDKGGRSYGLTYPSDPALFSDEWWQLTGWFMAEAKKQGAAVSLSDYTLGFGQGWFVDDLLRQHPELTGMELRMDPAGKVTPHAVPWSLNPLHPQSGRRYADAFFGQFETHFPGEGGCGLNFFFSDELGFGVAGRIWSDRFAAEFRNRKGYDLTPELPALFKDIGPRTPKVRLDYADVLVALSEEGFFKPVFDWHQQRGMTLGCDHGGRGRQVDEFGDYFRTQRWNQGPGSDQPHLGRDLIKAKVAASIAHLYERPRVWLEGFYGSGWGTSSAALVDATLANYVRGYNLLGLHGMYYSTHGGWWEWAPPDNTFRMPYWKSLRGFMDCQQRLAYLLSQGHHRCDVAILYPVAPAQAGLDGGKAVAAAFQTAEQIYAKGIDFDFMDFESLARARVVGRELHVAGEIYQVLVLPGMKAARHSTLRKALEFKRAGGLVLAVGALPEASDRIGRDDPEVAAMVRELFPHGATGEVVSAIPFRDYVGPGDVLHRRIGPCDVYALYNAPQGAECYFRATGQVELWDPWTGTTRPLAITSQVDHGTKLRLPLTEKEIQLIVFRPGQPLVAGPSDDPEPAAEVALGGTWEFELQPSLDNRFGDFHWPPTPTLIGAEARRLRYADETAADPGWQEPGFDDSQWPVVTCGFGPRFWKLGPLPDSAEADGTLASLNQVDPAIPVRIAGKDYHWQPYEFSWRFGIEHDCAHQGYHGLKEQIADDFIGLGALRHGHPSCARVPEKEGSRYYLWTAVQAPKAQQSAISSGGLRPAKVWLNGRPLAAGAGAVSLTKGPNPLLLRYDGIGRGWLVAGGDGADREAGLPFSNAANWIWWPAETQGVAKRYFRREITLPVRPASARLRITCDNGFTVFANGRQLGTGDEWQQVREFELSAALKAGANVIAVEARNQGGDGGLIAELILQGADGLPTRIGTDAQWLAAATPAKDWTAVRTDRAGWQAARVISPFAGSLWATHPTGPPELVAATTTAGGSPWNTDLAMRWFKDPDRLTFDTRPQVAQPAGWYRFVAPPGLRALTIPTAEPPRVWIDGREIPVTATNREWTATLARPAPAPAVVAIRVAQARGDYGGAAFRDFIRLDCASGETTLGDWSQSGVLETYSGAAWYRKTFPLSEAQTEGRVTLDLGNVAASAEVRVNGQLAGVKVAPPWTLDVSEFVKPGDNRLEVRVCNTLANHYVTIPTHYRGSTVSGLLGPVTLRIRQVNSLD